MYTHLYLRIRFRVGDIIGKPPHGNEQYPKPSKPRRRDVCSCRLLSMSGGHRVRISGLVYGELFRSHNRRTIETSCLRRDIRKFKINTKKIYTQCVP